MVQLIDNLQQYNIITKTGRTNPNCYKLVIKYPEIFQQVVDVTSFCSTGATWTERLYCIVNSIVSLPYCVECDRPVYFNNDLKRYNEFCTPKCAVTSKERIRRTKNSNTKRYAAPWHQQTPEGRRIREQTCIERYGVSAPLKSENIRSKTRQTVLDRYGVDNPFKSVDIKQKIKEIVLERHGVENISALHIEPVSLQKLHDKQWLIEQHYHHRKNQYEIAEMLGVSQAIISKYFLLFSIETKRYRTTQSHRQIVDFIINLQPTDIHINTKTVIPPFELDIFLPQYSLAIELDGIFWHSQLNGKNRKYHLEKTTLCNQKGISLIHIFENEWTEKQQIVKSRIKSRLMLNEKVYARNCLITAVSPKDKDTFLDQNHVQGTCVSSVNLGLVYNNVLVAIMIFGKSRFNKNIQYELLRYVSIVNNNVLGGPSRLLKHFIDTYHPRNIVSYCDLRYNTGKMYQHLGFVYSHTGSPNYFYFNKTKCLKLYPRIHFQKHKLKDKLPFFDPQLTEWENMVNNGYDRIWDCGSSVWKWTSN